MVEAGVGRRLLVVAGGRTGSVGSKQAILLQAQRTAVYVHALEQRVYSLGKGNQFLERGMGWDGVLFRTNKESLYKMGEYVERNGICKCFLARNADNE